MFKFKLVAIQADRLYGFNLRLLGVDFSFLIAGWLNDFMLLDLRGPCNYGIFVQIACFVAAIGRLPLTSLQVSTPWKG